MAAQGAGQDSAAAPSRSLWQVAPAGRELEVLAERRFDPVTGLRGATVYAMALDGSGIPWIGADDGLYSYAGGQWRRETLPRDADNQQVRSLLIASDGSRWVGTRRSAFRRARGGAWRTFREEDGLRGGVVFSLVESRAIDGALRVVAGTARGVSWFDGRKFVPLELPAGMNPLGMMLATTTAPDGAPELWAASSLGGVARLHRGTWSLFSAAEGLALADAQFALATPNDRNARLYVAGTDGVFALQRQSGGDRFVRVPGAPRNAFRLEMVSTGDGRDELWVGTVSGEVRRLRDGVWHTVPTTITDRHGSITLLKSVNGHGGATAVYASARSGYLVRLSQGVAGSLPMSDDAAAPLISAVYAERGANGRDDVWMGAAELGVVHVSATGVRRRLPIGDGRGQGVFQLRRLSWAPPSPMSSATSTAPAMSMMTAVVDSAVWRLRGSAFERADAGLAGVRVSQINRVRLPDGRDALVAATSGGLRLWSGTEWVAVYPQIAGAIGSVTAGLLNGTAVLFAGGTHQVHVVRATPGITVASEALPTANMAGVGNGIVRELCVSVTPARTRVVAYDTDLGIAWRAIDGGAWHPLPPQLHRQLNSLGVTDLACLPDGRLVVATFAGLSVFDMSAPEPDKWRVSTQVSDADGLPASTVSAIGISGTRDMVWAGTTFGLGLVDLSRAVQLPPARLTMRLTSEARGRVVGQGDVLGPDENDLHVEPILLTFHREELTRYRVRLSGKAEWPAWRADVQNDPAEGQWLDVPNRYYHDLAPGSYELSVWAYDWAGREYGPITRSFSVLTPNWRTWPARVIYVLWGVLLLTIAYRWRVRTIRESGEQLLLSERRARDSEGRFRAIFEQALDGHLLLEGGRVQAANEVVARILEVASPDALVGRTMQELLGDGGTVASAGAPTEITLTRGDHTVPVEYTITDVPSADRVLQHVVVRDLTDVRKAEAERAWFQAQVREAQKLESLGTLAGGVAHDFNNLLGVIRGNAELARTALKRGRSNDDNLGAILDASDRARDIVRQILTFSRRSTPTREYVNLSRLLLDLLPLLRRMVPRTVQLEIEGAEASHLLMGDPTQLQQLLLNLVSNAEYAMRSKTDGVLTLALSSRKSTEPGMGARDCVVLQVRDTGDGMSEEVRSRIFEPFFTTKPTGEGTGLGMAVVHGIVVSHEGRAEVFSEEGKGTTFEIRFPQAVIEGLWDEDLDPTALLEEMAAEQARDDEEPEGVLNPTAVESPDIDVLEDSPFAGTTIVVVDDEPAVAQVVERALQHYGHLVHVFNHPELALQFIRQQPSSVDLLITDQTMPGMTGDLLAESVHALRGDLPVLILTGFSHRLTPERIAAARAHAVLLKPVELAELKRRVDEALAMAMRR